MVPLLFLVAAIATGAGTIAGEEERGTLETAPGEPGVAHSGRAGEVAGARARDRRPGARAVAGALDRGAGRRDGHLGWGTSQPRRSRAVLLAIAYGEIAVLVGAASGRRSLAIGVTAAIAVAAYLVNGLAPLVGALEGPQKLSPFYHYAVGDPLRRGVSVSHMAVLVGIAIIATALAPLFFSRRDVST